MGAVSCVICTVPVGALAPENVTGKALVRFKLRRMSADCDPFKNANDSMYRAPLSWTLFTKAWFQVGFAPLWTVCSMAPPLGMV